MSSLKFPQFTNPPNESNAVGNAVDLMCKRELAQSAANYKALQAARAAEAKRQRQESIEAARVLDTPRR